MPPFDVQWARSQFPALAPAPGEPVPVYFDAPGGTQVPRRVMDAMADYLGRSNANAHGAFATSRRTDRVIEAAHSAMADLLGSDPDEIVFGPNMTSLTFALARSIGRELRAGDEIVLTRLDHDANFSPWSALEEGGVVVRIADVRIPECALDLDDLARKIGPRTRLVAVGWASNAVGTLSDVERIVRLAHDRGAWCFVDAVHYAPHGPIDVRAVGCDFLACSPYKFFGPHSGVLYGKREHLERLRPYKVRPAPETLPGRWETGTQCHEAQAGVAQAVEYLAELGRRHSARGKPPASRREALLAAMTAIREYERSLAARLVSGLLAFPGLTFYGLRDPGQFDRRTPTVAFRCRDHSPEELARFLGDRGIYAWAGHYYALHLAERLGVAEQGGMLRIGLVHYNQEGEIDRLLAVLSELLGR